MDDELFDYEDQAQLDEYMMDIDGLDGGAASSSRPSLRRRSGRKKGRRSYDEDEEDIYEEEDEEEWSDDADGVDDDGVDDDDDDDYESGTDDDGEEGGADEDDAMADAIMGSMQSAFVAGPSPSAPLPPPPAVSVKPLRMTDIGYRISQMVIMKTKEEAEEPSVGLLSLLPGGGEDVGEGQDVLLEKELSGRRRNRTGVRGRPKKVDFGYGKSSTVKLTPEVARLMGSANMAFVQKQYERAIGLLKEVIRQSRDSFEPYHTLGLIYEEMGHLDRAFAYYLLSAHLCKGDVLELWNKLAQLAIRLGKRRETLYCLSKVLDRGKVCDPRPYWIRSRLYLELSSYGNVVPSFADMLRRNFADLEQWQAVARLALRINLTYDAAKLFKKLFDEAFSGRHRLFAPSDVSWSHVNLLLEMYVATRNYEQMLEAAERFAPQVHAASSLQKGSLRSLLGEAPSFPQLMADGSIPIDIRVKMAIGYLSERLYKADRPLPHGLDSVALELEPEHYGDLRLALGDAYLEAKSWQPALLCLIPLLEHPTYGDVALCLKIGRAHRELGSWEDSIGVLSVAYQLNPEAKEVRVQLAETYRVMGQAALASQLVTDIATPVVPSGTQETTSTGLSSLDPGLIFGEIYGPTDVSLLYGFAFGDDSQGADGITWTTSTGGIMDEAGGLLNLPSLASSRRHPALRKNRRRARRTATVKYSQAQIDSVRADYQRCVILFESLHQPGGSIAVDRADVFLDVSTHLVRDDLMTNSYLKQDDLPASVSIKYRRLAPELERDLHALHGLYVDEWFRLLEMHVIVLDGLGMPERALKALRPFQFQSAFSHDDQLVTRMRLLMLSLARRAGKHLSALINCRWFLSSGGAYAPSLLYFALSRGAPLEAVGHPSNVRPVQRNAGIHPDIPAYALVAAGLCLARPHYEEAIRLYTRILLQQQEGGAASDDGSGRVSVLLAICLVESAFKRTCLQPKLALAQAFALLAQAQTGHPDSPELAYNTARLFQECGLVSKAVTWYNRVLSMPSPVFRRDAAYNLHLLYLQSGNTRLARQVLHQHCRL